MIGLMIGLRSTKREWYDWIDDGKEIKKERME